MKVMINSDIGRNFKSYCEVLKYDPCDMLTWLAKVYIKTFKKHIVDNIKKNPPMTTRNANGIEYTGTGNTRKL